MMRISIEALAAMRGQTVEEWEAGYQDAQRAYDDPRPQPKPQPRELAEIIPFPISAQQRRIESDLISVRDYEPSAAARYLRSAVRQHRAHLRRIQVSPDRIAADVAAMEAALGLTG